MTCASRRTKNLKWTALYWLLPTPRVQTGNTSISMPRKETSSASWTSYTKDSRSNLNASKFPWKMGHSTYTTHSLHRHLQESQMAIFHGYLKVLEGNLPTWSNTKLVLLGAWLLKMPWSTDEPARQLRGPGVRYWRWFQEGLSSTESWGLMVLDMYGMMNSFGQK